MNPLWIPPWPSIEPAEYDPRRATTRTAAAPTRSCSPPSWATTSVSTSSADRPTRKRRPDSASTAKPPSSRTRSSAASERLTMQAPLPEARLHIERHIELRDRTVHVRESGREPVGDGSSGRLDRARHARPAVPREGRHRVPRLGDPLESLRGRLRTGGLSDRRGPSSTGRRRRARAAVTADLRVYTAADASSAFTTHLMDPAARARVLRRVLAAHCGWRSATSGSSRTFRGWASGRRTAAAPTPPWNGQAVTRGMEFGVSPFPESRRQMIDRGRLFDVPTYRWIPAKTQGRSRIPDRRAEGGAGAGLLEWPESTRSRIRACTRQELDAGGRLSPGRHRRYTRQEREPSSIPRRPRLHGGRAGRTHSRHKRIRSCNCSASCRWPPCSPRRRRRKAAPGKAQAGRHRRESRCGADRRDHRRRRHEVQPHDDQREARRDHPHRPEVDRDAAEDRDGAQRRGAQGQRGPDQVQRRPGCTARDTDFIAPDIKGQVVAATKMAGPGETVDVTFKVPAAAGNYPYICTFPGHFAAGMNGQLSSSNLRRAVTAPEREPFPLRLPHFSSRPGGMMSGDPTPLQTPSPAPPNGSARTERDDRQAESGSAADPDLRRMLTWVFAALDPDGAFRYPGRRADPAVVRPAPSGGRRRRAPPVA